MVECFAYKQGECDALIEPFCAKEKCKFYKHKDTYKEELERCEERNYRLGIMRGNGSLDENVQKAHYERVVEAIKRGRY